MTLRCLPARVCLTGLILSMVAWVGCAQFGAASGLEENFRSPPASARPWVYWFWNNGNITREGITADLEAMHKVGVGGVLIMEVDQGAPVGPVDFMNDLWRELFKHVVAEARRLDIEVNMNDDAGWNGSGGPWIKPAEAMQKVVFTETPVEGPKHFEAVLPPAPAVAGYYRDIAVLAVAAPGAYRIDNIKIKAGFEYDYMRTSLLASASFPEPGAEMVIDRAKVVDLTARMDAAGRLTWDVPAGQWTILRFGHTCTGAENAPAPATGRGLECDKLSKEGIRAQFAGMMAKLIADNQPLVGTGKTLVKTHIDSWENGAQNWTAHMPEEFKARRGYDLWPYLPVLTGRVVGSLEQSERFLWDWRVTISDLILENYALEMQKLAAQHGMQLTIEPYIAPCNELAYAGRCDEPMCEFWTLGLLQASCKQMASAVHTYGKTILGAEAFTSDDREKWLLAPGHIKALGDRAFCEGVNRFVFHRYALQPWLDRQPGMTMGPWGLHYERTNTWWDWSTPWHEYLSRCQYLLRQGRFVADLCYLQPEAAPLAASGRAKGAYDYDDCSPEVVLTRMSVKDRRLVLPDGMSYRILVLPDVPTMTPALLTKIKELVEAGATVIGSKPARAPGLTDYPRCDELVRGLAEEIWGDCDGKKVTERKLGQGRVFCGVTPERVLTGDGVQPDFRGGMGLRYIHRTVGDRDIYFVANGQAAPVQAHCAFRVTGKLPELWWPETGRTEPAAAYTEKDGLTHVLIALNASGSVFVVFRPGALQPDAPTGLARNGEAIWSLDAPPVRVKVISATYGVPGDPSKTRDVREKAQRLVDSGESSFQVARMAEGDDPAYGTVKTLVLEYAIGDKSYTVKGRDPEMVHLNGEPSKAVVQKAIYGVPGDPQRTRDVTAKVQRFVDLGQARFEVRRLAEGDDPAYLVVKTVTIEYTINGKPAKASGTDSETIDLSVAAVPDVIALAHADGAGLRLEAWKPGTYELRSASGRTARVEVTALDAPQEVTGSWDVTFPERTGAPRQITLESLISLSQHQEPGVKYFSGLATYRKTLRVPETMLGRDRRVYLDLGRVEVMARVTLNGHPLGILWRSPYVVEITGAAHPGDNQLEVQVVNLWINRMIGDEQLPEDSQRHPNGTLKEWPQWVLNGQPSPTGRFTFTTWRLWGKDAPLQDSGLIGPVVLRPSLSRPVGY